MVKNKVSETITENIFRGYYGSSEFIEKSAIPQKFGFKSKKNTGKNGYPDFFKYLKNYVIIVEAKAIDHLEAEKEVQYYMEVNSIKKEDKIGIAVSGQDESQLKVSYYIQFQGEKIEKLEIKDKLLSISNINKIYEKRKNGESTSDEELITILKSLNRKFHEGNKVRETDRSLFFSGILIALTNNNFRNIYRSISEPTQKEVKYAKNSLLEAHHMNEEMLKSISFQLASKINTLSKQFSWFDRFSFIKNIDFSLDEYKKIIEQVETKIFIPYENEEKLDILGKAYKIFLSRAGSAESKNIILTPDHIRSLMIKLGRLTVDDVVLDTCTGSGGFLMDSMEKLINLAKEDQDKIERILESQLIGIENDPILFSLACSNMFLHGDGRSNLIFRSSLIGDTEENLIDPEDMGLLKYISQMKPTKCFINPPYESNLPISFAIQAINYIEANGKLIVIMPTPTLTKNQNGLTEVLLEKAKLDFVIKMPFNLFSEQKRTVNTSIFGFTKTPHKKDDKVLFYELEDDGFKSVQHKGKIDKDGKWNDIEVEIIDSINNLVEIPGVSQLKKIFDTKGDLKSYGYDKPGETKHEFVSLGSLFDIKSGTLASEKNDPDGDYDFVTAADQWKKHSEYTHDTEALIYATKAGGSLGKSQYVNGKFIASNLCLVLTRKPSINSEEYKELISKIDANPSLNKKLNLETRQEEILKADRYPINLKFYNWYFESIRKRLVSNLADGTSKLTINEQDLSNYMIEYISIEEQNKFVEEKVEPFEQSQRATIKAKEELVSALDFL